MKTYLDCIPCFLSQALRAARLSTNDEKKIKRVLEEIKKPVIYVVRNAPIINDATFEDALQAGLDKVATILSSGTDGPGTILETCSLEFKNVYKKAKLIISKGQGNYEALSNENRPLFFLLKAKCHVIAKDLGVYVGDIILKGSDSQI